MSAQLQTGSKVPIGKEFSPIPTGIVQRKCVCGSHLMAGDECAECAKKKSMLQRKLAIGASNDPLEQEADRVADQVMSTALNSAINNTQPRIQRFSGQTSESLGMAPPSVDRVLASSGSPLEPSLRQDMEVRFGHDFSQVRVHTGSAAEQSAREVNANAYTVGNNMVFGAGRFALATKEGQHLLFHELTHVVQQSGKERGRFAQRDEHRGLSQALHHGNILQREEFQPWPGQTGQDVPNTRQQQGNTVSERIQRTDDPNYAAPQPTLLEFDSSTCIVTATMEINFVQPSNPKARLSNDEFEKQKKRFINVANDKLNGWVSIEVGDDEACKVCRGKMIRVKVVAKEGSGNFSSTVAISKGSGRDNAGRVFASSSDSTFWHEAAHIVIGAPDEYPPEKGDPPRPKSKINTSDWSIQSKHHTFGRRAQMHSRHFSFMASWLSRRFPDCKFTVVELWKTFSVDVVVGLNISAANISGGWGLLEGLDVAAGIPLEKQRRLRLLVGGYADFMARLEGEHRMAFLTGALVGLDYSTNRSAGGFGVRADIRAGGAYAQTPSNDSNSTFPQAGPWKWTPTVGGALNLGYAGPFFEAGVQAGVGKFLGEDFKKDDPYFTLGLRAALNF